MATPFGKTFSIPEGLPSILRELTKDILREQPSDNELLAHAADFFQRKIQERADNRGKPSDSRMRDTVLAIFRAADEDRNGWLDYREFRNVLESPDLGIPFSEVREILAEADHDQDGRISYEEFVDTIVLHVDAERTVQTAQEEYSAETKRMEEAARSLLMHGLTAEELKSLLIAKFEQFDTDGNGYLSKTEFTDCLRSSEVHFTRQEINLLLNTVDVDQDGRVSLQEFWPVLFEVMVFSVARQYMSAIEEENAILPRLRQRCEQSSSYAEEDGTVSPRDFRDAIRALDVGITRMQIVMIVGALPSDDDGNVVLESALPIASKAILSCLDPERAAERADVVKSLRQSNFSGLEEEQLRSTLIEAFIAVDKDGSGTLSLDELHDCVRGLGLDLSERQVESLLLAADEDENGEISYPEFVRFAPALLSFLEREMALEEAAEISA